MNNTLELSKMGAAFEKACNNVLFKGSALEGIKRIAVETVARLIQSHAQERDKLQAEVGKLREANAAWHAAGQQGQAALAALQEKLAGVVQAGNLARKQAAARANRYKAKYGRLLGAIEAVLPGSKALLVGKALAESEKAKRLQRLARAIARQRRRVQGKVAFGADKQRDVLLPGHGREQHILQTMYARFARLEQQKSY